MPRLPRNEINALNSIYHIVSRGNNERRIFRSSRDYRKFLKILLEVKSKFPFYLYSFSLLPNHFHLEIETINFSISNIMHRINFLYASYFHFRYQASGHLFQDRFYSSLVDKESYFWEVARYIDLNSVKAGLVKRPQDYRWGSYIFYYDKNYQDKSRKLVDVEKFLEYSNIKDLEKARLEYLKFVEDGMKPVYFKQLPDFINSSKMN